MMLIPFASGLEARGATVDPRRSRFGAATVAADSANAIDERDASAKQARTMQFYDVYNKVINAEFALLRVEIGETKGGTLCATAQNAIFERAQLAR